MECGVIYPKSVEMSRYIDLEVYHAVERSHPYYKEMTSEILEQIQSYSKKLGNVEILELGAGTGLLTEELIKNPKLAIDALEIDDNCINIMKRHLNGRVNCICGDAVTFYNRNRYDIILSSFAHDHIHYDRRKDFARNIRSNLRKDGIYIMGGEILPYFSSSEERIESLHKYHQFIISKALNEGNFLLAQIEINALESGIKMIGDFKRHEAMFEDEMLSAAFHIKEKIKLGPNGTEELGGVFVYVFEAV
jgi:SAM-dependent methyltransferase